MNNTSLELVDEFLEETPGYDVNDTDERYHYKLCSRSVTIGSFGAEVCAGNFDGFISSNVNVSECDGRGEYNIVDCGLGTVPLI